MWGFFSLRLFRISSDFHQFETEATFPGLVLALSSAVAARSKTGVCCRLLAGISVSNPSKYLDVCHTSVVCCQVKVSATGQSLVQRRLLTVMCYYV